MATDEYHHVVDYFHDAPDELLQRMGADRKRLPPRQIWLARMHADHGKAATEVERLWLSWLLDGEAVGHSSLNDIVPGDRANIHLHLWRPLDRRRGLGTQLFDLSVSYAFDHLDLARLYCEPKADNPAPNRVVRKVGFELVETRFTTPGPINFEQQTNLYVIERSRALGCC